MSKFRKPGKQTAFDLALVIVRQVSKHLLNDPFSNQGCLIKTSLVHLLLNMFQLTTADAKDVAYKAIRVVRGERKKKK